MKRLLLLLVVLAIVLVAITGCGAENSVEEEGFDTFNKMRTADRAQRFAEDHPDCWEVHCNEFICWCAGEGK